MIELKGEVDKFENCDTRCTKIYPEYSIVFYITILVIVPLLKLNFAIPYIAAKVDQPVADEPGPAVVIEPGHHSLEEHPVMAFVVVKLVTKEEA